MHFTPWLEARGEGALAAAAYIIRGSGIRVCFRRMLRGLNAFLPSVASSPPPSPLSRACRAALVGAVWSLGAVPVLFGRARCVAASILHLPCPGCGLTRAAYLLLAGHVTASLHMHPLLVPCLAATAWAAAATVWATWLTGSPLDAWTLRTGRWAVASFVGVQVAMVALWLFRWLG